MENISNYSNSYIDKITSEFKNDLIPNLDKYVADHTFKEKMKTIEIALLENSAKIDGDLGKFNELAEKFVTKISKYPNYEETHATIKSIKLGEHGHVIQKIFLKLNPDMVQDSDVAFFWRESLLDEFSNEIKLSHKTLSTLFNDNEITKNLKKHKLLDSIKKNYPHPLKSKSPEEFQKSVDSFILFIDSHTKTFDYKETDYFIKKMKDELIVISEKINDYFSS